MSDDGSQVTSAYIHVPFCRHRCGYCNFTVLAGRDDLIADYLEAIERELRQRSFPQPVDTLFVGGGTPTHFSPQQLSQFLELITGWFPLRAGGEFSVEANPEDLANEKIDTLMAGGVTRVSVGIQSFQEEKLRRLERGHDGDCARRVVAQLMRSFPSVSADLIFAAPSESLVDWQADLGELIQLRPQHVSTYGLTYEPDTSFFSRRERAELASIDETTERHMYELGIEQLTHHGYEHYEVSNFAQSGHRCRHNENYWLCGEFYGIGPGAASYENGVRRTNLRSTTAYLKAVLNDQSPVAEEDPIDKRGRAHERLVFGLRRLDGLDLENFADETGFTIDELAEEPITWMCAEGLLERTVGNLRLTRNGLLVSDSIWPYLLD